MSRFVGSVLAKGLVVAALTACWAAVGRGAEPPAGQAAADKLPPKTDHPESREWTLTNYLRGTAAEIRYTLDKTAVESNLKAAELGREIVKLKDRRARDLKALADALHESPKYARWATQMREAEAALGTARATGTTEERLAAGRRFNKARAAVAQMDKALPGNKITAAADREIAAMEERRSRCREHVDKALKWRKELVDAVLSSLTLDGPVVPGETYGILGSVTVKQLVDGGKAALIDFDLFESAEVVGEGEGIVTVNRRGRVTPMLVRGLDNLHKAKPWDRLAVYQTFRVVREAPWVDGQTILVVEPFPTDADHLLATIVPPPDLTRPLEPPPRRPTKAAAEEPAVPVRDAGENPALDAAGPGPDRGPPEAVAGAGAELGAEDLDEFETFARKVVALIDEDARQRAAKEPRPDRRVEVAWRLLGTDLKRTDSVVHPVVAVATVSESHATVGGDYTARVVRKYTLRFARREGKWRLVQATQRVEAVEESPAPGLLKDKPGTETDLGQDWGKSIIDAAR